MEVFDEEKAVAYILDKLKSDNPSQSVSYSDDDILDVIDIIWDFYEDNGFLVIGMDDRDEPADKDKLIAHVIKMIKKDKGSNIVIDDIPAIVGYELEFEALCDQL